LRSPLEQQTLPAVVHAHVGAVHHLGGLPVDAPGHDPQLPPDFPPPGRGPAHQGQLLFPAAEILLHGVGQLPGQRRVLFPVGFNAVFGAEAAEFFPVHHRVAGRVALGHFRQHLHQVPAVVGMGRRARGDHPAQVPGHDDVRVRAANAPLGAFAKGVDPARPHVADTAGKTHFVAVAFENVNFQPQPNRKPLADQLILNHLSGGGVGLHGQRVIGANQQRDRKPPAEQAIGGLEAHQSPAQHQRVFGPRQRFQHAAHLAFGAHVEDAAQILAPGADGPGIGAGGNEKTVIRKGGFPAVAVGQGDGAGLGVHGGDAAAEERHDSEPVVKISASDRETFGRDRAFQNHADHGAAVGREGFVGDQGDGRRRGRTGGGFRRR
jgi:hypothetical protein